MNFVRYEPDALLAKYRSRRATVLAEQFYTKPRYRQEMELWCAAQFARGYSEHVRPCAVWVTEGKRQSYFDFKLEAAELVRYFQLTEVMPPGRRRGDEYRRGGPARQTTSHDWDAGELLGGEWLSRAIRRKHARYAGDVANLDLLVYLNFLAVELQYSGLRDQAADDAASFRSVWLLSGKAIACIRSRDEEELMARAWMFLPEE